MSYINDALKKAQRERDERYARFGGIIDPAPVGGQPFKSRRVFFGAAMVVLVLILAGLLTAVYVLPPLSVPKKGPQSPVVAATPTAEAASREADIRYREALAAQRRGESAEAEALYRKVLLLDPSHVRALNNIGVLYLEQKQDDRAVAMFSQAIVLKKNYVDPYYNLACLYARAKQIEASLRYLKMAMAIDPDVKNWLEKDADMKNVVASPAFKKFMEGQRN
jgi:tetratricopeptide (TPR) repeat protein